MVLVNNKDAIVLETTVDNDSSAELIGFNQNELDADIKAVIAHHFHIDSIGGLEAFHSRAIPSDANKKTIDLCIKKGYDPPQIAIEASREIKYVMMSARVKTLDICFKQTE